MYFQNDKKTPKIYFKILNFYMLKIINKYRKKIFFMIIDTTDAKLFLLGIIDCELNSGIIKFLLVNI